MTVATIENMLANVKYITTEEVCNLNADDFQYFAQEFEVWCKSKHSNTCELQPNCTPPHLERIKKKRLTIDPVDKNMLKMKYENWYINLKELAKPEKS